MTGYVLGRNAEQGLDDLWDYIAADSIDAADRLAESLFDAFENLARNPGLGDRREDLTPYPVLFWFWPVEDYLVIYRAGGDPTQIVAIVHGKRDVPAFLRPRVPSEHSERQR